MSSFTQYTPESSALLAFQTTVKLCPSTTSWICGVDDPLTKNNKSEIRISNIF